MSGKAAISLATKSLSSSAASKSLNMRTNTSAFTIINNMARKVR